MVDPKSSSKHTRVFVSILRVETPRDAHWVCGMWLRGVVWSIHRDCISSFAFWLYNTQPIWGVVVVLLECAVYVVVEIGKIPMCNVHGCHLTFPTTRTFGLVSLFFILFFRYSV